MKKIITLMALLTVVATVESQADLLAGTQASAPYAGRVAIGEYGLPGYSLSQARLFSTGGAEYYLDSILFGSSLYLENGSGGITISLYSDAAGLPGAPVAGGQDLFSASAVTIDQMLYPSSTVQLEANTAYWFVASVDQSGGATRYWWDMTDSALFDSDVVGTDLPLTRANDALGWSAYTGASTEMSIYGTVIPEPGTISLLGIGAIGTLMIRRKKRRSLKCQQGSASLVEGSLDAFNPVIVEEPFLAGERSGRRVLPAHRG